MDKYVKVTRPFHRGPVRIAGSGEEYLSLNVAIAYAKRHLVPIRLKSLVEGEPLPRRIRFETLEGNYIGELSERGGFVDPLAGYCHSHELRISWSPIIEIPTAESIHTKKTGKAPRLVDKYTPPKKPAAAAVKKPRKPPGSDIPALESSNEDSKP